MPTSPDLDAPWSERVVWAALPPTVRGLARVLWRLEVEGETFPDPPFVVASNHHSFLDPILLGAIVGRKTRFLALVDLFGNYRWLDTALKTLDAIPVKRGVVPLGPVRAALAHLETGIVGLFPEGTRHDDFDPSRSRPGAAWLATRAAVPLVPVAISGTERVLGVDNRPRRGRVRIAIGPALEAEGTGRSAVDQLSGQWGYWMASRLR